MYKNTRALHYIFKMESFVLFYKAQLVCIFQGIFVYRTKANSLNSYAPLTFPGCVATTTFYY